MRRLDGIIDSIDLNLSERQAIGQGRLECSTGLRRVSHDLVTEQQLTAPGLV